ncbi:MAG: hypothetical protein IKT51_04020, partial [Phascolarctobacterium sp.]|nr:hypothetical protein [Phascolarctobacterium sp.]
MKKNLAKKVTLSILAGAVLMSSSVVWAGQIIEPEPKIYWEYRDGIDGCVRLPANTKGDVSLVIEDYGDLDSAEAFYGAVSFEEGTTAANGIVTINDNLDRSYEFTGDIYGGRAFIDGGSDANNNKVYITTSKATIKSDVYGGYSDGGSVEKNSVTIEAGTFSDCYIDGGCSEGSNAEENSVTVTGGTISGCIIRGGSAYGGYAKGNSVTVKDGTFSDYEMTGGEANGGNAEGNSVTIAGGTFQGYMSGG